MSTTPMTRADVIRVVHEARKRDTRPCLPGVDLRGVDLSYLDLSNVFL